MCMANEVITIENHAELERLLSTNPEMQKKLRKITGQVLRKARASLSKDARAHLPNDPRQAYRAVKSTVYRRMLGGNVSILQKRKASSTRVHVEKDRKLRPGQRGGNRLPRGKRTEQLDSYWGSDRGFILRFNNAGTDARTSRYGNRGSIAARNWFPGASQYQLQQAAAIFCQMVDKEIEQTKV